MRLQMRVCVVYVRNESMQSQVQNHVWEVEFSDLFRERKKKKEHFLRVKFLRVDFWQS